MYLYSESLEASEQATVRALAFRYQYDAEGVCLGSTKAPSVTQSNSPSDPHKESAEAAHTKAKIGREASWLKKVRNVKG